MVRRFKSSAQRKAVMARLKGRKFEVFFRPQARSEKMSKEIAKILKDKGAEVERIDVFGDKGFELTVAKTLRSKPKREVLRLPTAIETKKGKEINRIFSKEEAERL